MKLVFVSNFLNNHQLALCEEFVALLGKNEFRFIATQPLDSNLAQFSKYENLNNKEFVIKAYGDCDISAVRALVSNADCAIIAPFLKTDYLNMRLEEKNRLTFVYMERVLKRGVLLRFFPLKIWRMHQGLLRFKGNSKLYILCASAYVPYDLSLFHFPISRCLKWGYFPKVHEYGEEKEWWDGERPLKLLWVGRLIDWKRPEMALDIANLLKSKGIVFSLKIIGDGPFRGKIENGISTRGLDGYVTYCGALDSALTHEAMFKHDVLIVTSSRKEGWGAVVNEGMANGCVVCAGDMVGSVPYLIEDGVNGLVCKDGCLNDYCSGIEFLYKDYRLVRRLGSAAKKTIKDKWNAKNAAQEFVKAYQDFASEREHSFVNGPCDRASLISDGSVVKRME